jgi:hypothetical protein
MICEKCGAAATDGTANCPECGEPMAPSAPAASVPVTAEGAVPKRRVWVLTAIGAIVLLAIAAAGYFLWPKAAIIGPEGAATRMLEAYAAYDGAGMLANAAPSSLTATDVAAFEKQMADTKVAANGKPTLTDLKILKTTVEPKDPNTAVVQVSAQWLTDPATGTYTQRTDQLTVIYKDGKWLVRLFQ